jgi:hypothetical protein
LLIPLYI